MGGRGKHFGIGCIAIVMAMVFSPGVASAQYREDSQFYKAPTRKVPARVHAEIVERAEKRYPDNGLLQQHTIETQEKAYFRVQAYKDSRLPSQELVMIKRNAARENPHDYARQLISIKKQIGVYLEENNKTEETSAKPAAEKAEQ